MKQFLIVTAALAAVVMPQTSHAASQTWTGTSNTTWSTGSNWLSGNAATSGDTAIFGATAGTPANQPNNPLAVGNATASLLGLDFQNSGTYAVSLTGTVIYLGSGGLTSTRSTAAGSVTIGNNIRATTDQVWNIGTGASVTETASLYNKDDTGTSLYNFEKTGAGNLTISGTGGNLGGTGKTFKITDGVVSIAANAALGSTNSSLTLNGGTLATTATFTQTRAVSVSANSTINTNASTTLTMNSTISGGGGIAKTGTGTLNLTGNNGYTGLTDVQAGILSLGRSGGTIADTAAVTVSGGTLDVANSDTVGAVTLSSGTISGVGTLTGSSYSLTNNGTISASLAGSGNLTKTGAGTATLSGTNTSYTGTTTLSDGTLSIATDSNLGSTTNGLTFSGGTLQITGNAVTSLGSHAVAFTSGSNVGFDIRSTNMVTLSNNMTQGNGGLTLSGASINSQLILTGNNSAFTGTITVNSGKLNLGDAAGNGAQSVNASNALVVNDGVVAIGKVFIGGNATVGSLSGTGGIVNGQIGTNGVRGFKVDQATNTTYAGSIQDEGAGLRVLAFTKAGVGTLALTGNNTFSGATTVENGTLELAGTSGKQALGATSSVMVTSGGTLLLSQSEQIKDSATVTLNGGKFSTGGLNETVGALTLSSNSTIDLGSGASTLHFAASNGISWNGTLAIWNWNSGTDHLFFGNSNTALTSPQLNQVSFYSGSGSGFLGTAGFGSSGELVAVPEPSTWVAMAALILTSGIIAMRRRRQA